MNKPRKPYTFTSLMAANRRILQLKNELAKAEADQVVLNMELDAQAAKTDEFRRSCEFQASRAHSLWIELEQARTQLKELNNQHTKLATNYNQLHEQIEHVTRNNRLIEDGVIALVRGLGKGRAS
jgi:chromosome segregation ATPase